MKKTDIAMIVLIAGIGVLVAYLVATSIPFLRLPEKGVEVKTIRGITTEVNQPDESVFNTSAINPSVEVIVGDTTSE